MEAGGEAKGDIPQKELLRVVSVNACKDCGESQGGKEREKGERRSPDGSKEENRGEEDKENRESIFPSYPRKEKKSSAQPNGKRKVPPQGKGKKERKRRMGGEDALGRVREVPDHKGAEEKEAYLGMEGVFSKAQKSQKDGYADCPKKKEELPHCFPS